MHILDFSTVSYQKYQFYIIPIQIILEDAILNFYFESKCACLAAMLDSFLAMSNCLENFTYRKGTLNKLGPFKDDLADLADSRRVLERKGNFLFSAGVVF